MSLLDFVLQTTKKYIEQMPKSQRKKYGQFFTDINTARFMVKLFSDVDDNELIKLMEWP